MKTLSIKLTDALNAKLQAAAKMRRVPKSELVREALQEFLLSGNGKSMLSCLDLSEDLAGSLDGPTDLSTNKDYMEGFGQ